MGKNLAFSEDICLEKDSVRSKMTPRNRLDGVVVRASDSKSVELGFISLVESYLKTLKNGIHSFPAWRSAHKE